MKSNKTIDRLIEKYLSDDLDPTERELVDRLVESDNDIRKALLLRKKINKSLAKSDVYELKKMLEDIIKRNKYLSSLEEPASPYLKWYYAVAIFFLLIGLGSTTILFLGYFRSINSTDIIIQTDTNSNINKRIDLSDSGYVKPLAPILTKEHNKKYHNPDEHKRDFDVNSTLFAHNFTISPYLESFIDNFRSNGIKIISPTHLREYIQMENITFSWEVRSQPDSVYQLTVYDNHETIIYRSSVENPYILRDKLRPGLYYWKIEIDNELLYLDKFKILYQK
jgi:hypothetical protein